MTHYAVLWMFGNYYASHQPGTTQLTLIIIAALLLLVGASWLVMKLYDIPVRNYLNAKRLERLERLKVPD